jgi:cysteine-rich repeat protein
MVVHASKPRSLRSARLVVALLAIGTTILLACTEPTTKAKDDKFCTPGAYVFCRCQDRQEGAKLCKEDAKSFGPCEPCETFDNPEIPDNGTSSGFPEHPFDGGSSLTDARADADATATSGCGDGIVQAGEDCDDKRNPDPNDGCDLKCKLSGAAPLASNSCPGLVVHVWGGDHKPTLVATTKNSGNRQLATPTPGNCTGDGNVPTSGSAGPDRVFQVIAHKTGTMTVATTETDYNCLLYVANACADDVVWTTCANKVDGIGGETISFPVTDGKTYYVFVDGALPSSLDTLQTKGDFRVTFAIQ